MYEIKRTAEEIDRVMNWAAEGVDEGSHYPGMSYEDGIRNAIEWIVGDQEDAPDE